MSGIPWFTGKPFPAFSTGAVPIGAWGSSSGGTTGPAVSLPLPAIGQAYRLHGRCTCRNNANWPHCSTCQDHAICDGCPLCALDYRMDKGRDTPHGAPWHNQIHHPDDRRDDCAGCQAEKLARTSKPPRLWNGRDWEDA